MFKALIYNDDYAWVLEDSDFTVIIGDVKFEGCVKAMMKIYENRCNNSIPEIFRYLFWRNKNDENPENFYENVKSDIDWLFKSHIITIQYSDKLVKMFDNYRLFL